MSDTRCTSMVPMESGVYRCTYEHRAIDGHTEHHYNYFRALTAEERQHFFPASEPEPVVIDLMAALVKSLKESL